MTRLFAFQYEYRNTHFAISLPANDAEDAKAKLKAMGAAEYQGEIIEREVATIQFVPGNPTVN